VRLVLERAFTQLGLHRVEANIIPSNTASLGVARNCGFRKEGYSPRYLRIAGTWQDHERWAMTIEDWHGLRSIG
jgi:ribosomal-protein-alanine N-acetyltransferase